MPHLVTEERFRVVRSTPLLLPTFSTNKGMTSISTFDITKEPLLDLLRDIQQGKIQLVDFQRSWCWDEERIERVIASVSLGFPVGAVMLLQQGNPDVKFKPRLVESLSLANPPVPTALILDGQQRLTSLFMSLLSDQPVRIDRGKRYPPEQRWYYIDIAQALDYPHTDRRDAIWGLTVDKKLYRPGQPVIDCSTPKKEFELGLFPISQVFNFPQWRSQYCKYWHYDPQKLALIDEFEATVIKKFEHYQMGLFVLRAELPKEAVCYIFEENNKRQCELTQFDLLTSSFAATDFDLRSDWIAREKRFSSHPVLRLLKPTDFLQAIALMANYARRVQAQQQGCHPERLPGVACNRQDVLGLELAQYQHWMEPIGAAFEEVARFLHTQAIFDANDLPYAMQLVVMAPLFAILGEGTKLDWVRQVLQHWFYCGAASGIYSRSREGTAAKDLLEVSQWVNSGEVPSTVKEAHLSAERLQSLLNSQGATYRAIAALLRRDGALDFVSGEPITAARYFDEKIENHHIFPQQWCKRQGIPRSRYNSIINKTPLTAKTNKFLGGKAPSEYLAKLEEQGMSRQRIDEILRLHLIEPTTLHNDDFEAFFELRTQALLARKEKAKLECSREAEPDQAPTDNSSALWDNLFTAYDKSKSPRRRCAIAYLLKNNCQVSEVEEDPEAYQLRRRNKEIEIERLKEQLNSRLPKGRNLSDKEWLEALEQAQGLILDDEKFREVQASLTRKQSSVPFPISYETNTDLRWSRNEHKRICVSFNGKGISNHTFEVFCNKRQLQWFERFDEDYKIFTHPQNQEQVPGGLLTLRSARLVWQEGEGEGEPWQVHRLLLHCSVDTRLWTAEGTEEVRAEKIAETQKIINGMKAKGSQSKKLKDYETSLKRLQTFRGFSRPSRAGYKGNPSIVIGVSFGRVKPATVAVVNVETGEVLAYRDVKQLLSKPIQEGKTNKKKTQYEYLKSWREQQRLNSHERHKAQKNGAPCNFEESKQGEYVDRLLAKAIVEVAKQYRASSIVLPDLRNIREATESEVKARAEQRFPGYQELQDGYAKDYRASIHRWRYNRLAECIQVKAQRAGIATEKVHQPHSGTPQEKARDLVLAAYENRKVSAS